MHTVHNVRVIHQLISTVTTVTQLHTIQCARVLACRCQHVSCRYVGTPNRPSDTLRYVRDVAWVAHAAPTTPPLATTTTPSPPAPALSTTVTAAAAALQLWKHVRPVSLQHEAGQRDSSRRQRGASRGSSRECDEAGDSEVQVGEGGVEGARCRRHETAG